MTGSEHRKARSIVEAVLGKSLPQRFPVHHHNKEVVVCESISYHHLLDQRQRAYYTTGDVHKRKCKYCKKYDVQSNLRCTDNGRGSISFWHTACSRDYSNANYPHRKEEIKKRLELLSQLV